MNYNNSMMGGFQGPHPPDSAIDDNNNSLNSPSFNHSFDISPSQFDRELNFSNILRIGTLNVRSLVHASKQFNLFSLLLSHQLHDRLISLLLQLPGRQNLLVIGAYIPPSSGLNNKLIADCHSTLISWITSARVSGTHVMLGGDLNANFDKLY
ncbi:unnamed protein product [Rhizophagus irregularis]|nr:unnamed protein product [Rhizophagus irregularis]